MPYDAFPLLHEIKNSAVFEPYVAINPDLDR